MYHMIMASKFIELLQNKDTNKMKLNITIKGHMIILFLFGSNA